jgi:hypothetical protein
MHVAALFVCAAALGAFQARPAVLSAPHSAPTLQLGVGTYGTAAVARPPARAALAQIAMFSEPPPQEPEGDIFEDISEDLTGMQRQLKKLNPFFFGATTKGVTVLSALVAWFLTPPGGRVAAVASLGLGGAAGSRLGKRMRTARRGLLPSAIADMVLEDGLDSLQAKNVEALAEQYGVEAVEFESQLSSVYARYLREIVGEAGEDGVAMWQVRQLGMLRRGMGLRWNATEAVHVGEAVDFLDGEAPPSDAASLPEELRALLWLSSALFSTSRGAATVDRLSDALGADADAAQGVVNDLAMPIYRKAVAKAVGKYNRTQAPEVLLTARRALQLSDAAADAVHASVYEAQLSVLLGDDDSSLGEEEMEILGELEGVLQVRGAAAALRCRTEPLYESLAQATLAAAFGASEGDDARRAVSVWGRLALRQQELRLSTEVAKAAIIVESRRLCSEALADAVGRFEAGEQAEALKGVERVLSYAAFLGEVIDLAGLDAALGGTPADLSERYLGALTLPEEVASAAAGLASAATAALPDAAGLTRVLFSRTDPALSGARDEYLAALESSVSRGSLDDSAASEHEQLASRLGLPPALVQRLAVDAYYGWLTDASERADTKSLESTSSVRGGLRLDLASTSELYANTNVDELVISTCCEQILSSEGDGATLSASGVQQLTMLDRQLGARPGVGARVIAEATEASG